MHRPPPVIIGHRGACGHRPEHTFASYELAIELGADWIECDVVPTREGALVCRHESELSRTTDVAAHSRFASRKTRKVVDGVPLEGWFAEDFTLEEISMLRACEPLEFRDHRFDGQFGIPTLDELLDWAEMSRTRGGRPAGVVIEIKHPTYFASIGFNIEMAVANALQPRGYAGPNAPVIVESFEVGILQHIKAQTGVRVVQLLDALDTRPWDFVACGDPRTYREMITAAGLAEIASYAFAAGPWKRLIIPAAPSGAEPVEPETQVRLSPSTSLIRDAHAAGLHVHAWTFRNEVRFLAGDYANDPHREYAQFFELGLDGFITDFPDTAALALRRLGR